jgi:hippurate hydrolase
MIKDGLFEQFPMEAVFGMHNWPGMAVGQFAVSPGPVMASSNEFKITITGKGGHAAAHGRRPGADRLPDGAGLADHHLAQQEAGGRGRDLGHHDPRRRGHQRDARRCEIQGTVRTFTYETLDLIERRMQEMAEGVAAAFGARCAFEFVRNYPPTINTAEAEFCRQVMAGIVGADHALAQEPTMGAEDFAYMLQAKPGAYCFIANGDGAHRGRYEGGGHDAGPCTLHNPQLRLQRRADPAGRHLLGAPGAGLAGPHPARRPPHARSHGMIPIPDAFSPSYAKARVKFLEAAAAAGAHRVLQPPAARQGRRAAGDGRGARRRGRQRTPADRQQRLPRRGGLLRQRRAGVRAA